MAEDTEIRFYKNVGMSCDNCDTEGFVGYATNGWWGLPLGWMQRDTPARSYIACSEACVHALSQQLAKEPIAG